MKSQNWNFGKAIRPGFADPVTDYLGFSRKDSQT